MTATNACRSIDQSVWKEVSLSSAKLAEPTAPGCEAWKKNRKKFRLTVAAHNLGLILRKLLDHGKPRGFEELQAILSLIFATVHTATRRGHLLSHFAAHF